MTWPVGQPGLIRSAQVVTSAGRGRMTGACGMRSGAGQHRRGGVLPAWGPPAPVYKLRIYHRRKGEAKGFTWQDYRDLIIAAHRELSAPRCLAATGLRIEPQLSR